MTESGGTGNAAGGGTPPADGQPGSGPTGDQPNLPAPGASGAAVPDGTEMPRWEPFAATPPPSALPDEATLTPAPADDAGSIVPDQLPDAPSYVPPPIGMTAGGVMPPSSPSDAPSSAWITTAPPAQRSGGGNRIGAIIGAIVLVVIVGAVVANFLGLLPSDKGKILFGTAAGSDLCSVANATTTVTSTDPVFFAAVLKHHMDGNQAITFTITKGGTELINHPEPADGTSFDCYGNKTSLGTLDPGTYVFTVVHNGDIEATGTLTVH